VAVIKFDPHVSGIVIRENLIPWWYELAFPNVLLQIHVRTELVGVGQSMLPQ